MTQEQEKHPHVGGTGGASSDADPQDAGAASEPVEIGAGNIEMPIGLPVSEEEFRRLKNEARRAARGDEENAGDQAQEDPGTHDDS